MPGAAPTGGLFCTGSASCRSPSRSAGSGDPLQHTLSRSAPGTRGPAWGRAGRAARGGGSPHGYPVCKLALPVDTSLRRNLFEGCSKAFGALRSRRGQGLGQPVHRIRRRVLGEPEGPRPLARSAGGDGRNSRLTGPRRPDFATTACGGPRNPGGDLADQADLTVRPAKHDQAGRIGAPGFEPGTSASRTQRSTGLSHAPRVMRIARMARGRARRGGRRVGFRERVTGFEPATSTLARLRSTN